MQSHHNIHIDVADALPGEVGTRLPFGEHRTSIPSPWRLIIGAYTLYVVLTFLNDVANTNLQNAAALVFLGLLAVHAAPHLLPVPLSGLTVALFFAAFVPVFGFLAGFAVMTDMSFAIKYFALLFVILAAEVLGLPPLYRAKERRWGMIAIAAVMLLSLAPGLPRDRFGDWVFTNPNNFALVAMSLLFFVDHEHDSLRLIIGTHTFVATLVLLSGTAGALLAYLTGLGILLLKSRIGRLLCVAGILIVAFTLPFGLLTLAPSLDSSSRLGSVWSKISLTREYYTDLAAGQDLNFWEIGQQHGGTDLTSALWRLSHWREIRRTYQESGWGTKLFGHGLGSSRPVLGRHPHNDYLRLWFEVGAIGLLVNLSIWVLLFRRAGSSVQVPVAMMALYAVSENIINNFLVMSLFALLMVSACHNDTCCPVMDASPKEGCE